MARGEGMGGFVEAVKRGALQAEVARQAYRFEQKLASGEIPKVGANCYVGDTPAAADREAELYASDPKVAAAQIARLERIRRDRDGGAVARVLAALRDEAQAAGHLMDPLVDAVKAYATLGEIARALKDVFGEHKEPVKF